MQDQDKARNEEERKQATMVPVQTTQGGKKKKQALALPSNRKNYGITSFMLFVKTKRPELIQQNPKMKQEEITTLCGTFWKQLDDKTKQDFKELADKYNIAKKNGQDPNTVLVSNGIILPQKGGQPMSHQDPATGAALNPELAGV